MTGTELVKINDNLKQDRSMVDSMWQDIATNMVFRKASIVSKVEPGVKLTQKMFDSTATLAGQDLAAWINGNMTGQGMDWFSLKKGGEKEQDKEFQEWLENARKIQLSAFRNSNRASEWNEVLLDLVFFNTGAYFIEEKEVTKPGFNGFNYISLPPGTYCAILGRNRRLEGMFREFTIKAQEAVDRWPNKVTEEIKKDAIKDPSKSHTFIHACFPQKMFGGNHRIKSKPFVSYYVDAKKKIIMHEGGYYNFPFFMIPWLRESGEIYGRGPGWTAMPEVKTAHRAAKLDLQARAFSILPAMGMVDQGVIGSVRLTPGGLTVVKSKDSLFELFKPPKYGDNKARKEDQRLIIREIFHGDKVRYLPPREQTGQMTAYETARRYQQSQLLLGPAFGNIIDHGLDPEVEFGFNVMYRAGAFGDSPIDIPDEEWEIQYESPLAKAQRVTEVEAINNTLEAVGRIFQVKEDIYDNFKLDDTALQIASNFGYPTKLTNSEDERKVIRDATAKAKEKQAAIEQAALLAKAGKDAAGAVKDLPPGVMEKLTGK